MGQSTRLVACDCGRAPKAAPYWQHAPSWVCCCSRVQWPRPPPRRTRAGCHCAWGAPAFATQRTACKQRVACSSSTRAIAAAHHLVCTGAYRPTASAHPHFTSTLHMGHLAAPSLHNPDVCNDPSPSLVIGRSSLIIERRKINGTWPFEYHRVWVWQHGNKARRAKCLMTSAHTTAP